MSIDDRARSATGELRAATAGGVRMATMTELEKTSTHRRRTRAAAAATAVIVAVGVGAVALTRSNLTARPGDTDPVTSVSASLSSPPTTRMTICAFDRITCLGGRTVRANIAVPVTVNLPTSITSDDNQTTPTAFESYVDSHSNMGLSGVTVLEKATATTADNPSTRDPSAGSTAAAAAAWLATRPFIQRTTPVPTTVAGLPAYRVHVVLKPGARLTGVAKADESSAATFASGESWSAVTQSMNDSTYYLLDLPHGGLTVIWSWTFGSTAEDAAAREAYVRALRFG